MTSIELLFEAACRRVRELAAENRLTEPETDRILKTFKQAMANPFLDENRLYGMLTGKEFR